MLRTLAALTSLALLCSTANCARVSSVVPAGPTHAPWAATPTNIREAQVVAALAGNTSYGRKLAEAWLARSGKARSNRAVRTALAASYIARASQFALDALYDSAAQDLARAKELGGDVHAQQRKIQREQLLWQGNSADAPSARSAIKSLLLDDSRLDVLTAAGERYYMRLAHRLALGDSSLESTRYGKQAIAWFAQAPDAPSEWEASRAKQLWEGKEGVANRILLRWVGDAFAMRLCNAQIDDARCALAIADLLWQQRKRQRAFAWYQYSEQIAPSRHSALGLAKTLGLVGESLAAEQWLNEAEIRSREPGVAASMLFREMSCIQASLRAPDERANAQLTARIALLLAQQLLVVGEARTWVRRMAVAETLPDFANPWGRYDEITQACEYWLPSRGIEEDSGN